MKYIVTARKWRPGTFEEIVGQEHIARTLKNAIVSGRVAHAYLFTGPRGVGKTTTARILAKTLNCIEQASGEPCNKCEMCNTFNSSQSLDIIEIDGASNRRIEEIRALRESVKYSPTKGTYKVYIIDEVHMLTNESFNALLKTLEEPPEHTIFIFATTDVHKVPLTIISRCQRFDFRRIELEAIKNQLLKISKSENIEADDKSLTLIAKKADGSLRDAQSLFDQVITFGGTKIKAETVSQMLNLIDEELYFRVSDSILSKSFSEAFDVSKVLYDNGWNYIDFLSGLVEHFRNIMTIIIRKDTSLVESSESIKQKYLEYVGSFTEPDILRILTYLSKSQSEIKSSQNQKLLTEVVLSHIIGFEKTSTISELLEKIKSGSFESVDVKKKDRIEPSQIKSNIVIEEQISNSNTADQKPLKSKNKKEISNLKNNSKVSKEVISNVEDNLSPEESSLINAILNELGGKELRQ